MATAKKRLLAESIDGKAIKVVAVATPGTQIHAENSASQTEGSYDEVWLWAYNGHTANVQVTIEFGGVGVPDDNIVVTVPPKAGLVPVLPGLILQNGLSIKAFASVANVVTLSGFVNMITD